MNERRTKLEAIFHAVLELNSAEEREAYLTEACGADVDLRRELEALLKAALEGDALFKPCEQAGPLLATTPAEPLTEHAGTVIGRYKLLEKIGEGGMGVVYMAEQEQPVRRKVALKIIKLGMDTQQVVARFEAERQALAMMDHPNIAQVLDAGATETGRPYFVMELVQGVPITEFCEANQLSIEERLKLFVPVCEAIQSAHQKGIIHRDIKPSNVLVTMHNGAAHPMVIDFGVAKAIDQKLTEKTLFTNFATMIGTPAYMSPEQAEMSKLDVDTRSDIYSLGVLLYELLTGTTPFSEERLRSVAYGEMQRIIVEEDPERPSTRRKKTASVKSEMRHRESDIDSDLDWIVMRCLEKDRKRRYETSTGLAADIQSHLRSEPVSARPPSAGYRFRKFVRRNRLQFAAGTFALAVVIVAAGVSGWQAIQATRAEKEAKRQARIAREQTDNAEAVKAFLLENLLGVRALDTVPEPDALSYEATEALVRKVARQLEGKFTNQPSIEAEVRFSLGKAFGAVRNFRNAAEQYERALQIWKHMFGPAHSNSLAAVAHLAFCKSQLGEWKEAEGLLTNCFAFARNPSGELLPGGETVIGTYGLVLRDHGQAAKALPYLEEAITAEKKLHGAKHIWIKQWMADLAKATEFTGRWDEAEKLWRELLQQCERDHGLDHFITVQEQFALARLLIQRDRLDEAFPMIERVVSFNRRTIGVNHSLTLDSEFWLGQAYEKQGEIDRAVELYRDVHPRFAKFLPNQSAIFCEKGMAKFFVRQKLHEDAKAVFKSLATALETHARSAEDFEMLVQATVVTKGWPAAAEVCRDRIDDFPAVASAWRTKATTLLYARDYGGYRRTAAAALASPLLLRSWTEQQSILNVVALGTNVFSPEEKEACERLIATGEQVLKTANANQRDAIHRVLGAALLRLSRPTNSLEHLERASYASGINRARTLVLKAICLHHLGRVEQARAASDEAESLMRSPLLARLSESDGFLATDECTYLIHRREAQALLGLTE